MTGLMFGLTMKFILNEKVERDAIKPLFDSSWAVEIDKECAIELGMTLAEYQEWSLECGRKRAERQRDERKRHLRETARRVMKEHPEWGVTADSDIEEVLDRTFGSVFGD